MRFTSLGTWDVTVVETDTQCTESADDVLGNVLYGVDIGALLGESGSDLIDQDSTGKTTEMSSLPLIALADLPSTDNSSLFSGNGNIVTDQQNSNISGSTGSPVLLGSETEVKRISGVVHDNDQGSLFPSDKLDTSSDLSNIGGSKDISANSGVQET
jgi:hypothetical protein